MTAFFLLFLSKYIFELGCSSLVPSDLKTMSKRVESEMYYVTFEMFVADVKRMFHNARTYNAPETIYYKCATRYENCSFNWYPVLSAILFAIVFMF